jgi:hypothetical protein
VYRQNRQAQARRDEEDARRRQQGLPAQPPAPQQQFPGVNAGAFPGAPEWLPGPGGVGH